MMDAVEFWTRLTVSAKGDLPKKKCATTIIGQQEIT